MAGSASNSKGKAKMEKKNGTIAQALAKKMAAKKKQQKKDLAEKKAKKNLAEKKKAAKQKEEITAASLMDAFTQCLGKPEVEQQQVWTDELISYLIFDIYYPPDVLISHYDRSNEFYDERISYEFYHWFLESLIRSNCLFDD